MAVVGVNEHRWNWLRFKMGFTKPCGCGARSQKLNESGGWLRDRVEVMRRLLRLDG